MKYISQAVVAIALVAAGMFGLYHHIEYAGWVLFVGLLVAVW